MQFDPKTYNLGKEAFAVKLSFPFYLKDIFVNSKCQPFYIFREPIENGVQIEAFGRKELIFYQNILAKLWPLFYTHASRPNST